MLNHLEGPDFDVVDLESRVVSVPGGVPTLLSVVEVGGGVGGGVHPRLRGGGVHGVIGEVSGHLRMKNWIKKFEVFSNFVSYFYFMTNLLLLLRRT